MARKITVGVVPGGVGDLTVDSATISTNSTNQDLELNPNGTGRILAQKDLQLQNQADLRLADADSSNWLAFQAPAVIAANYTLTMPSTVPSSGNALVASDSSGTLTWGAAGATLSAPSTNATFYPTFSSSQSGSFTAAGTSTGLAFNPSTATLTVTNLVESSSIALKENILPIENALENLLKLTGVTYDRRDGSRKGEAGLIAEDVVDVLPNLVTKNPKGDIDGIQYTKLTAYLIEAVKSLKLEIDSLKGVK
jgi:hypothetical protein